MHSDFRRLPTGLARLGSEVETDRYGVSSPEVLNARQDMNNCSSEITRTHELMARTSERHLDDISKENSKCEVYCGGEILRRYLGRLTQSSLFIIRAPAHLHINLGGESKKRK